ncbi:hypothetical protein C2S51_003280 [Perilla frutescens var. frutescens]|nr:hypothetical protein C2S51_003280 [Perilla frutescens var. frutescens]
MIHLSSRGSRRPSTAVESGDAVTTLSLIIPFLACFNLSPRKKSAIYHNSALSERVMEEEDERVKHMNTSIDDLPDLVLMDFIHRLPVSSIFTSKSVSKRWNFLISDPLFARCSAARKQPCSFALFYVGFVPGSNHPCRIGPYIPPFVSTFPLNYFTIEFEKLQRETSCDLQLIGCSSDLLLFSGRDSYCVCNPLTFKWSSVRQQQPRCIYPVVGFLVEDDGTYWIVQILASDDAAAAGFHVYCSTTEKWSLKKVASPLHFDSFTTKTTQVYQGSIVWMVDNALLCFNPRTTIIRALNLPSDRRPNQRGRLGVSSGRLHYYQLLNRHDPTLRVWTMVGDDFEAGEWVMNHEIRYDHFWSADESLGRFPALPNTRRYLRWVSFNPVDCDIVFLKCERQLVTCKLSSACLEVLPCHRDSQEGIFYRLEWDVIPLVFKPWPTAVFITSKEEKSRLLTQCDTDFCI